MARILFKEPGGAQGFYEVAADPDQVAKKRSELLKAGKRIIGYVNEEGQEYRFVPESNGRWRLVPNLG